MKGAWPSLRPRRRQAGGRLRARGRGRGARSRPMEAAMTDAITILLRQHEQIRRQFDLELLGSAVLAAEVVAPTHPHPTVHTEVANLLAAGLCRWSPVLVRRRTR